MTRIVICRHGNTFDKGDTVTRVGARTDLPLSLSGQAQAEALGLFFSPQNSDYNFKKAYCSPLIRTRQTADAILKSNHTAKQAETLAFLTEIDYGPDENMPEEAVIDRIGVDAITAWNQEAKVPDGWHINSEDIVDSWRAFIIESTSISGDILVVTSNGIARFVLQALSPPPDILDIKLETGAFGTLAGSSGHLAVQNWNQRP